ncbi:deoxyguanosinetriphosphate triphosphohydrolase family protein [Parenemella sanctibonifatiensis]|nr:dNTP triphosphohydrolase [Parenemella sanctibonifatiensis]
MSSDRYADDAASGPAAQRMLRERPETGEWTGLSGGLDSESRTDLERLRFAPAFSRLAEVTQVVTAGTTGSMTHNRLSHSIKVTAVARAISVVLVDRHERSELDALGGLDPVVVQAAAVAHDLGHPPFGHLGEQTLDRLARDRFGLTDGFEGNAQTFRILTELEVHGPGTDGLNLTAATRAAVLKYPWGHDRWPDPHPTSWQVLPRGARPAPGRTGSAKFGAYVPDITEMIKVRDCFPQVRPGQQTLECSVMDLADDIAYSLHDLEDFHRSGVLQYAQVSSEFDSWLEDRGLWSAMTDDDLQRIGRAPGAGLERLRRRLADKDEWIYSPDAFSEAVELINDEFVNEVLAMPYDGSIQADRTLAGFLMRWLDVFSSAAVLLPDAPVRAGLVGLSARPWHRVQVLKFIHQYFVLDRPDLAMAQRGQADLLVRLIDALDAWLSDDSDAARAPHRLRDLIEISREGYSRVNKEQPQWLGSPNDAELARMARGRGIIDYVAGLTDSQAIGFAQRLSGTTNLLWATGVL